MKRQGEKKTEKKLEIRRISRYRHIPIQAEKHTSRQTDRQLDGRQASRHADSQAEMLSDNYTDILSDRQTWLSDSQTEEGVRQASSLADTKANRHAVRPTDRQSGMH